MQLDRVWKATRPEVPEPDAWEAAWARIEQGIATRDAAVAAPMAVRGVRRRVVSIAGGVLAAAAAMVVAWNLPEPSMETVSQPAPIRGDFKVLVGETVVYHVDSGASDVVEVEGPEVDPDDYFAVLGSRGLGDEYFAMLGFFEAKSEPPLMASTEDEPAPSDPLSP